jgi:hypothetical protein
VVFASAGTEIELPPGNGVLVYCFWIHQPDLPFDLTAYYIQMGQISQYIVNFIYSFLLKKQQKWLENQSNQGCMAEVMQLLEEAVWQINTSAESYKRILQTELNIQ